MSFKPQIDCFATRINTQLSQYFSRRPDTEAKFIDTFTVNWRPYLCCRFPATTCIAKDSSGASRSANCTLLANPALVQSHFELRNL